MYPPKSHYSFIYYYHEHFDEYFLVTCFFAYYIFFLQSLTYAAATCNNMYHASPTSVYTITIFLVIILLNHNFLI